MLPLLHKAGVRTLTLLLKRRCKFAAQKWACADWGHRETSVEARSSCASLHFCLHAWICVLDWLVVYLYILCVALLASLRLQLWGSQSDVIHAVTRDTDWVGISQNNLVIIGQSFTHTNEKWVSVLAGDSLPCVIYHSESKWVCSVVTVSPVADGGRQTGCLSSWDTPLGDVCVCVKSTFYLNIFNCSLHSLLWSTQMYASRSVSCKCFHD